VTIKNSSFYNNTGKNKSKHKFLLKFEYNQLKLIGAIKFYNISQVFTVIRLARSTIQCESYIEFASIKGRYVLEYDVHMLFYLLITNNTIINITQNQYEKFAVNHYVDKYAYSYPFCYFQYITNNQIFHAIYSIIFKSNHEQPKNLAYNNLHVTHCKWLNQSAFGQDALPLEVNKQYIKYIDDEGVYDTLPYGINEKTVCVCNEKHHDCYQDNLGKLHPGQTLTVLMSLNLHKVIETEIVLAKVFYDNQVNDAPSSACVVVNSSENVQYLRSDVCMIMSYTIAFPEEGWCELFIRSDFYQKSYLDIYYIKQIFCPLGFIKIDGVCRCFPFLLKYGIVCNINDQTILRPHHSWIFAVTNNNTYDYHISLSCSSLHCLPYSTHLKLSEPDSQCKFKRTGILCGQCQQGFSTVFGSTKCQQCSSIYLLLIIPMAIVGIILVVLLFILNLTVTIGTINMFILYVNITSIFSTMLFQQEQHNFVTTFISLANFDLGIKTCFYDGMDDYAKVWLELTFPFYLLCIAISFIISSRYSTKIQRFTARRALPVLATLFLSSYTKILLVVSSVLFSYSTITHLPSGHSTLVWSVDANVPLFSIKFIVLFATCLVIFAVQVPFTIILLFTRTLSRFNFISKFKPLLDAYHAPYKDGYYNWTGLQLVVRVIFIGISSLDRQTSLTIGIMLLAAIGYIQGFCNPLKNTASNISELMFLFNLTMIFSFALKSNNDINSSPAYMMIIIIVAIHFGLIVTYHIITFLCGKNIRINTIRSRINRLVKRVKSLYRKKHDEEFELPEYVRDRIPDKEVLNGYRSL